MSKVAVGFTGTQRGMTGAQRAVIWSKLVELAGKAGGGERLEGHHGDCIGADSEFHRLCRGVGAWMVGHPPLEEKKRAWCGFDEEREPREYLERNKDIVKEVGGAGGVLLACPFEMVEVLRSGTWSTVRYARRVGLEVEVVLPTGDIM